MSTIEQLNLCQILTLKIMKKSIFLSLFVLALTFFSCTADSLPQVSTTNNATAGDIGGQNGQIPVNPPKP